MASLFTHVYAAVALAPVCAPRPGWKWTLAAGIAAATLPDVDVFGLYAGIPYRSFFGHRGFTHSLFFALLLALLLARLLRRRTPLDPGGRAKQCLYLFQCGASHGLLDALTTGGYGVGFLMPFESGRHFFGWTPLPVAPLGVQNFFTPYGAEVLRSEIRVVWMPLAALALLGLGARRYARSALRKA